MNISNQVSEGSFTHSHRVIEHVKDLSLAHIFTMDFTLADECFPMEDRITFNATLDRGSHMNVTWEFGDGTTEVNSASIDMAFYEKLLMENLSVEVIKGTS